MHKSRLGQIIIDCRTDDLDDAAAFWAAALGTSAHALPDAADQRYRQLKMPQDQINILVQSVAHESRVHLDLETDDIEAEVRRLQTLGAKRVRQVRAWWVMEAPTGQRFCVLGRQRADLATGGNTWA